jgi:hypothetical protein
MESAVNMRNGTVAAVLVLLVVSAGCTTEKERPAPVNPSGPVMGPLEALNAATGYLDSYYMGTAVIVPFTLVRKMQGGPCPWEGERAGNATNWMMIFEGILASGGFGRDVTVAVTAEYRSGKIGVRHIEVGSVAIGQSDADRVMYDIDNVSLASNISFDSHAMFSRAEPLKYNMSSGLYYLQSITMTLYDRTTSPHGSDGPTWEAGWKYIAKDSLKPTTTYVILNATTGAYIKTLGP